MEEAGECMGRGSKGWGKNRRKYQARLGRAKGHEEVLRVRRRS